MNERLGSLAYELRDQLNTATLAFEALKGNAAPIAGATGAVLARSLSRLRELIDRSLADVRLSEGLQVRRERVSVRDLIADMEIGASLDANSRGRTLKVVSIDETWLNVDRQMISSAVSNLLQNAFKFTRPEGNVTLTAVAVADYVRIEIEDECGGLPPGRTEELFAPFQQRGADRTGLGLGLSMSRRGVEANRGKLSVRNLPGKGCVFTIDLPRGQALA